MKRFPFPLFVLCLLALGILATFVNRGKSLTQTQAVGTVTLQVVNAAGAAQSNAATLTGATSKLTYIEGFDISGGGATGASVIEVTVTGITNTLKYEVPIAAGAAAPAFGTASTNAVYSVRFPTPIPSSATNTNIVVTCPSFGSGNTNASVVAYGFTQ
jgi:hypothetical protein